VAASDNQAKGLDPQINSSRLSNPVQTPAETPRLHLPGNPARSLPKFIQRQRLAAIANPKTSRNKVKFQKFSKQDKTENEMHHQIKNHCQRLFQITMPQNQRNLEQLTATTANLASPGKAGGLMKQRHFDDVL
jgi:hypothetical protein